MWDLRADHCSQKYRWNFLLVALRLPDAFWCIKTFFSLNLWIKIDTYFKLPARRKLSYFAYYRFFFSFLREKRGYEWTQSKTNTKKLPRNRRNWKNDGWRGWVMIVGMIVGIRALQQTAEMMCNENDHERKRSGCGNRKGIIKRVLYSYKV